METEQHNYLKASTFQKSRIFFGLLTKFPRGVFKDFLILQVFLGQKFFYISWKFFSSRTNTDIFIKIKKNYIPNRYFDDVYLILYSRKSCWKLRSITTSRLWLFKKVVFFSESSLNSPEGFLRNFWSCKDFLVKHFLTFHEKIFLPY